MTVIYSGSLDDKKIPNSKMLATQLQELNFQKCLTRANIWESAYISSNTIDETLYILIGKKEIGIKYYTEFQDNVFDENGRLYTTGGSFFRFKYEDYDDNLFNCIFRLAFKFKDNLDLDFELNSLNETSIKNSNNTSTKKRKRNIKIKTLILDLDNTLIYSDDLESEFRGIANTKSSDKIKNELLRERLLRSPNRVLVKESELTWLKNEHPEIKLCILTTAPEYYTNIVLQVYYPSIEWEFVLTFESGQRQKPDPQGVLTITQSLGITNCQSVAMIGDNWPDIEAAYRAGVWSGLYKGSWPRAPTKDNYRTMSLLPDYTCNSFKDLYDFICFPVRRWPLFELWHEHKSAIPSGSDPTITFLNYFPPGINKKPFKVWVSGRYFARYSQIEKRRNWHSFSHEIDDLKEADKFPFHWIKGLDQLIKNLMLKQLNESLIVTVIPAKMGRPPRLERLLLQLESHFFNSEPYHVDFIPDLFYFDSGARSHHRDHLTKQQRFENVSTSLRLNKPELVNGRSIIVIDDVVTSGATFFYADLYLKEAGASCVILGAIAKTITGN